MAFIHFKHWPENIPDNNLINIYNFILINYWEFLAEVIFVQIINIKQIMWLTEYIKPVPGNHPNSEKKQGYPQFLHDVW